MDMDQQSNVVLGGAYSTTTNWNSQNALVTYIERVSSLAKWTKTITGFEDLHTVTFNAGANDKVAALIHNSDSSNNPKSWTIITIQITTANVLRYFHNDYQSPGPLRKGYLNAISSFRKVLLFDASDNLYFFLQTKYENYDSNSNIVSSDYLWAQIKFAADTITVVSTNRAGTQYDIPSFARFNSDQSAIYATGISSSTSSAYCYSIQKFLTSTLAYQYGHTAECSTDSSKSIDVFTVKTFPTLNDTILAHIKNSSASIQFHYLSVNPTSGQVLFQMRVVSDLDSTSVCQDLFIENATTFYALVTQYSSEVLTFTLLKYQFNSKQVSATDFLLVDAYGYGSVTASYIPSISAAIVRNQDNLYYFGALQSLNSVIFSGISKDTAYLTTLDSKQSCIGVTKNLQQRLMYSIALPPDSETFSLVTLTYEASPLEFIEYDGSISLSSLFLSSTLSSMKALCSPANLIYMSPLTITNQEHIIESPENFTLSQEFFTGYYSCDDGTPNYQITLQNGSPIPNYLNFSTVSGSSSNVLAIQQNDTLRQDVLFIKIKATFSAASFAITTFRLELIKCYNATIAVLPVGGLTSFTYDITLDPGPLKINFTATNTIPQCTFSYYIDDDWSNSVLTTPDTEIFTFKPEDKMVVVETRNASKSGVYSISVLPKQDLKFDKAPFNLAPTYTSLKYQVTILSSPCSVNYTYTVGKDVDFTYTLGTGQDLAISLQSDLHFNSTCKGFKMSITASSTSGNSTTLPSFIKFDEQSLTVKILQSAQATPAPYTVVFFAAMDNFNKTKNDSFNITIKVLPRPNLSPPIFSLGLKPLAVKLGEETFYKLPTVSDKEGDKYEMLVNAQNATSFIKANTQSGLLSIYPVDDANVGIFFISITLTDKGNPPLSSEYTLGLTVEQRYFNLTDDSANSSNGREDAEALLQAQLEKSPAFQKFKKLTIRVTGISSLGVVSIQLSDEWPLVTMLKGSAQRRNLQAVEEKLENITIVAYLLKGSAMGDSEALILPFKLTSLSATNLELQTYFEDPQSISSVSSQPDYVIVRLFNNPRNRSFDPLNSNDYGTLNYKSARRSIPIQMSTAQAAVVEGLSSASTSALYGTLASNFFIQFFLSNILQLVWFSMNNLQLIVLLPLLSLSFPPNAQQYLEFMANIANFDILPTNSIFDAIFQDQEYTQLLSSQAETSQSDQLLNFNFQEAGYQSSNVIRNIKSFFFFMIIIGLGAIAYHAAKFYSPKFKFAEKLAARLGAILFYNSVIRFFIESYLSLSLACFIGLASLTSQIDKDYSPQYFAFNSFVSFALLIIIAATPLYLYIFVKRNHAKLRETAFLQKFSTIYSNLKYEKTSSLVYILFLFYKRFIVAFTMVFLREDFNLQMIFIVNTSLFFLIYYIVYRPFDSDYINRIEIFNESTFLLCTYLCFLFTDILEDTSIKLNIGWFFILVIVVNLVANFSGIFFMIYNWGFGLYRKLKRLLGYVQELDKKRGQERTVKVRPRLESVSELALNDLSQSRVDGNVSVDDSTLSKIRSRANSLQECQPPQLLQINEPSEDESEIGIQVEAQEELQSFREELKEDSPTIEQQEMNYIRNSLAEQNIIPRICIVEEERTFQPPQQLFHEGSTSPAKEPNFVHIYSKKGQAVQQFYKKQRRGRAESLSSPKKSQVIQSAIGRFL